MFKHAGDVSMGLDADRKKVVKRKKIASPPPKKYRLNEAHLNAELNRINREHVAEMQMHNNAQRIFEMRYPKMKTSPNRFLATDDRDRNEQDPDFGSRQRGEYEMKPSYIKSLSVNMQDLHVLLFTNGEIDIDKVLCLYLLTAHKTETLRIPPKSQQRVCYKARMHLPLERLIERAKHLDHRPTIFPNLPLFILDVPVLPPKNGPRRDARLAGKVIINTKILRMIHSVKMALEVANPQLLKHFVYLAHDRSRIENTMMQPKMEAFYRALYGQNIISSCESFQLEVLPKNCLTFRIDVEPLEELVRLMRSNVLYVPNSSTWRKCLHSKGILGIDDRLSLGPNYGVRESEYDIEAQLQKMNLINPETSTAPATGKHSKDDGESLGTSTINDDCSDDEMDDCCLTYTQPKIMKNLELGFSEVQVVDEDEDEEQECELDPNTPIEKLAVLLDEKVREVSSMEYQNFLEGVMPSMSESELTTPEEIRIPVIPQYSYNAKQVSCMACLKRCRDPMPTPKISKIKKIPLPQIGEASYFFSKSAQRISDLLNEKVRQFELEEQEASRSSAEKKARPARASEDQTIEIIDLKEIDLAKIRLEIKETETAKKMRQFFASK